MPTIAQLAGYIDIAERELDRAVLEVVAAVQLLDQLRRELLEAQAKEKATKEK